MALRKERGSTREVRKEKVASSGSDFATLMKKVPAYVFAQMISRSGMPHNEARELCKVFKELK